MSRHVLLWIMLAIPASGAFAQHAEHGVQRGAQELRENGDGHAVHSAAAGTTQVRSDPSQSERDAHDDHGERAGQALSDDPLNQMPPHEAFSGPQYAADTMFDAEDMAAARKQLRIVHGGVRTQMVLADRFEARIGDDDERFAWDLQGWYGGDIHKLWWKSEGNGELGSNPESGEIQLLYGRAVTPHFDFQAGLRHDIEPSPRRSHAVLGIQGLLPYVFEIDAAAFVSEEGDVTGRFEAEYDLRIRQRLVLQPRVEMNFAAQAIPELGVGPGLGSIEGGLRLRYEFRRELAPYVGFGWERKTGGTADFARAAGDDARSWELIVGIRAWF